MKNSLFITPSCHKNTIPAVYDRNSNDDVLRSPESFEHVSVRLDRSY